MLKFRTVSIVALFLLASLSMASGFEMKSGAAGHGGAGCGPLQAACGTCQGKKDCHACGGSGQTTSGASCIICNGNKKCYVCNGSGEF